MVELVNNQLERVLVGLAIEAILIEMGDPVYEKVTDLLYKQYKCQPIDCYDHPEYLNNVLKTLFGSSDKVIIKKIEKELGEFVSRKSINNFLILINE
ncbi:MAG: hypothetical protein E6L05_05535 [Thaumarchaeota archaeon]|nr:MAG: hypothetical protein E6L05_05535 [Nitrososphaerota archaeon]